MALGICRVDWECINFVRLNCCSLHCFGHTSLALRFAYVMFQTITGFVQNVFPWAQPNVMNAWLHTGSMCMNLIKSLCLYTQQRLPGEQTKDNQTLKWIPYQKALDYIFRDSSIGFVMSFIQEYPGWDLSHPEIQFMVIYIFRMHLIWLNRTLSKRHMLSEPSLYSHVTF